MCLNFSSERIAVQQAISDGIGSRVNMREKDAKASKISLNVNYY